MNTIVKDTLGTFFSFSAKRTYSVLFALLAWFVLHWLIIVDPLSRFEYIEVEAHASRDVIVSVYPGSNTRHNHRIKAGATILATGGGKNRVVKVLINSRVASASWLEFTAPAEINIARISYLSFFGPDRHINGKDLQRFFRAGNSRTTLTSDESGLNVKISGDSGMLAPTKPVRVSNPLLSWGFPALLAFIIYLALSRADLGRIPAIQDINYRDTGDHVYRVELDALRGLAALLVILEHTWGLFEGVGRTGVWIFFVLSGYLLAQPFVNKPERATQFNYVSAYMMRRLARILPMYYFTVIIMIGLMKNSSDLPVHLLFLKADDHLWTIPQEMVFYFFLPGMMLALYYVKRVSPRLVAGVLAIVAMGLMWSPGLIPVRMIGMGSQHNMYLGWFFSGMVVAYLAPKGGLSWKEKLSPQTRSMLSLAGIGLMGSLIVFSMQPFTAWLIGTNKTLSIDYGFFYGLAAALLLFTILLTPSTLLSRLLTSRILRAIGVVGYSYYLIHPLVMKMIKELTQQYSGIVLAEWQYFITTAIISWTISVITYSLIERPFLARKKSD